MTLFKNKFTINNGELQKNYYLNRVPFFLFLLHTLRPYKLLFILCLFIYSFFGKKNYECCMPSIKENRCNFWYLNNLKKLKRKKQRRSLKDTKPFLTKTMSKKKEMLNETRDFVLKILYKYTKNNERNVNNLEGVHTPVVQKISQKPHTMTQWWHTIFRPLPVKESPLYIYKVMLINGRYCRP